MFSETIENIKHEILWINYELSRQSTSQKQENILKKKKNALEIIMNSCMDYDFGKIAITEGVKEMLQTNLHPNL